MFPATPGANARGDRWRPPAKPCGKIVPSRQTPAAASADSAGVSATGYREGSPRRFGIGPAVVPGQDLADLPGPVRDGAVADLAARDRKMRNDHSEAAGT